GPLRATGDVVRGDLHRRRTVALDLRDRRERAGRLQRAAGILDVVRVIRLVLVESVWRAREEIRDGLLDVGEVRAFARIEHLVAGADRRRAAALRGVDRVAGIGK